MKKATKVQRTISGETMTDVMLFAPQDSFKLDDELLNKEYTVTNVVETEFGNNKSFIVTLENEDGKVINLGAAALKKARVLSELDAKGGNAFPDCQHVYTRPEAEEIWNKSVYFHSQGMKKNEDFTIPGKFKLRYAVLGVDQETGDPILNPFLYKGYKNVVTEYQKRDEFPTIEDFKAELLKSEVDGRIAGLPLAMTAPIPQNWVKGNISEYRHTLVISDIEE